MNAVEAPPSEGALRARGGFRTLTPHYRAGGFKPPASAVPPPGLVVTNIRGTRRRPPRAARHHPRRRSGRARGVSIGGGLRERAVEQPPNPFGRGALETVGRENPLDHVVLHRRGGAATDPHGDDRTRVEAPNRAVEVVTARRAAEGRCCEPGRAGRILEGSGAPGEQHRAAVAVRRRVGRRGVGAVRPVHPCCGPCPHPTILHQPHDVHVAWSGCYFLRIRRRGARLG